MADGTVMLISKAPGNRTIDYKEEVGIWTNKFDAYRSREDWLIRKDCLPMNFALDRTG